MPIAVVLILLVVGTLAFHFMAPLYGWTFTDLASNWSQIDDTINITILVTGIVFVAVNLFMAYAVIKYRAKEGGRATYDPENKKLEAWLTVLTAVGVAAMLTPGLFVWGDFVNVPDDAMEIEAVGQQWHWSYRLPGEDGEFGDVRSQLITGDNPFGMDPEDPMGQDDILVSSPQLHLPVNVPVKVNLRSKDVLHNFA
ncbi:MAG: cytochrome-c oxidase, partial [Woeseiaceae bacterium]|nr:cytochrome-c oxidase [Woeseiaceae bacterium]